MIRNNLKKYRIPDSPGVYLFRDARRKILYIGKAASLRDRVRSYFASDLAETRNAAIAGMIAKIATIAWEETGSVLEALILEANLIKKHQPPYNVDQKDDKSWNYLVITKEEFPRVLIVRGRELFGLKAGNWKPKAVFGPFPQGGSLKEALRLVRKIFPFRDKCIPCDEQLKVLNKKRGKLYPSSLSAGEARRKWCRACFNRQIGLCPGVCTGEMSTFEYKETIRNITELFSGGMPARAGTHAGGRSLRLRLEKEMKEAAKDEQFEKAEILRRQVSALSHIRDVSLIKEEYRVAPGGSFRIEAYDVAHTAGSETVGVMIVVAEGGAQKSEYRMFKVRGFQNNDPGALSEILGRRLAHPEWTMPRLIVVDGGKAQLRAALRVLAKAGVSIPIVSVVKNEFHRPERMLGEERLIQANEKDILLANSEAHRFAIAFHRHRRGKRMLY